jgi:small redox-active disulfide protein 2
VSEPRLSGQTDEIENKKEKIMIIKILGSGCAKCKKLHNNVETALKESGIDATLEKVEDINKIIDYGVMMTPALVIDENVKSVGKVLSSKDIVKLIS